MKKQKNIILVYFNYHKYFVTPLDLGYAATYVHKHANDVMINIHSIKAERAKSSEDFAVDTERIAARRPDTVIFFLDNILLTGMFYEGLAMDMAAQIKKINPHIKIGFHSFKTRHEYISEILAYKSVDFILHDEVEIPLLDYCTQSDKRRVRGMSYRWGASIRSNQDAPLISDLDELPSPYLTGIFDNFIAQQLRYNPHAGFSIIATRGCKFRCHYCFRSVKHPSQRHFTTERVLSELKYLAAHGVRRVLFLDDTFLTPEGFFKELAAAYMHVKESLPDIYCTTRPELVTAETAAMLANMRVRQVQLGLQSITPTVQKSITRPDNFTFADFANAVRLLKKQNISVNIDIIFGLPGDTLDGFRSTLEHALSLSPSLIQIKQLYLNPETVYWQNASKYKMKTTGKLSRNIPVVTSNATWTRADMRKAHELALETMEYYQMHGLPTQFKIVTEYGHFGH